MRRKSSLWLFIVVLVFIVIAGCSGNEDDNAATENANNTGNANSPVPEATPTPAPTPEPEKNTDPVSLALYAHQMMSEEEWNRYLLDPLKEQFPHIELKVYNRSDISIDELLVSGVEPDLYTAANINLGQMTEYHMVSDIHPLAKKHNADLTRFKESTLDAIRVYSDSNELYGLPYKFNLNVLYYNEDLFDMMGVDYPKDGMTWNETLDLARNLTRNIDGVQYYGIHPDSVLRLGLPLSVPMIDDQANKANIDNASWRRAMELAYEMFKISDFKLPLAAGQAQNLFSKDRTLAMMPTTNIMDNRLQAPVEQGLKLGIAQYPSYEDHPNTYGAVDIHMIGVTSTSKHRDAAWDVMSVLTSDDVQMDMAKALPAWTPLNNREIESQFGVDLPFLGEKQRESIFKSQPAPGYRESMNFSVANGEVNKVMNQLIKGETDLNTGLKNAEEIINLKLAELKNK